MIYATDITTATDSTITVVIPDRGHGAVGAETVTYAWSGTTGEPQTCDYNSGPRARLDGGHSAAAGAGLAELKRTAIVTGTGICGEAEHTMRVTVKRNGTRNEAVPQRWQRVTTP